MKIAFLIGGQFPVYTLKEIKETDPWAYDEAFYYQIKALERNAAFKKEVKLARVKLVIPEEGMDFSDYYNQDFEMLCNTNSETKVRKYKKWLGRIQEEKKRIYKKLQLPEVVRGNIPSIIIANFVGPTIDKIEIGGENHNHITHLTLTIKARVTKNELIRFIEAQWPTIAKYHLPYLPDRPSFYISPRDLRIVDLRDEQKLSFRRIAEEIVKEFNIDDPEGKINEDSIKTAYRRAKRKIAFLTKPSKGNR